MPELLKAMEHNCDSNTFVMLACSLKEEKIIDRQLNKSTRISFNRKKHINEK